MKEIKLKGSMGFLTDRNCGRIYDKEVLKKAVEDFKTKVDEGVVLGEMDHNDNVINLNDVTHKVKGIEMEEDLDYTADIEILDTPKGMLLQKMLEEGVGVKPAVRGMGDEEHLEIISIDLMGM